MEKERITGIILAAGKSSRMGTEKGLLSFKSINFIENIINTIKPFCDEIIISSNSNHYDYLSFKIVDDNYNDKGPIAGLEACLSKSKTDKNLFVLTFHNYRQLGKISENFFFCLFLKKHPN